MTIKLAQAEFMDVATAANWACVSRRTVRRWINRGLPVYGSGPRSKLLIKISDIEAFLTRRQAHQPDLDVMVQEVLNDLNGKKT